MTSSVDKRQLETFTLPLAGLGETRGAAIPEHPDPGFGQSHSPPGTRQAL